MDNLSLPISFNGWHIISSECSYINYEFYHDDHDGSPDGVSLCGHAESIEECIEMIIDTYYRPQDGW